MKVRTALVAVVVSFVVIGWAWARTGLYELPVNTTLTVTTIGGVNLPIYFGPTEHYYAVFK
ncbi:MAG: hypothetical protein N2572_10295, partial [Syntrophales bacterium]|nr:hypothetical protein [Syntrophales bacterium]